MWSMGHFKLVLNDSDILFSCTIVHYMLDPIVRPKMINTLVKSDLLGPSAQFVTMIRKPADNYESKFGYYHMEEQKGMNLSTYIRKLERNFNWQKWEMGPLNNQLEMFGVHHKDMNKEMIMETLAKIDYQFNLVMLTERFDESLVLLANTLCWKLEDVVTLKLNSRVDKKKVSPPLYEKPVAT